MEKWSTAWPAWKCLRHATPFCTQQALFVKPSFRPKGSCVLQGCMHMAYFYDLDVRSLPNNGGACAEPGNSALHIHSIDEHVISFLTRCACSITSCYRGGACCSSSDLLLDQCLNEIQQSACAWQLISLSLSLLQSLLSTGSTSMNGLPSSSSLGLTWALCATRRFPMWHATT